MLTRLAVGVSYIAASLFSKVEFIRFTVRDENDLKMWERIRRNKHVKYTRTGKRFRRGHV